MKQLGPDDATLEGLIDAELDNKGMTVLAVALILMQRGVWTHPVGQPHLMTRDIDQIKRWIAAGVSLNGSKPTRQ